MSTITTVNGKRVKTSWWTRLIRHFSSKYQLYLMLLPAVVLLICFYYVPMYGLQLAFRKYTPQMGLTGGDFAGAKYIKKFIHSYQFWTLIKNTLSISITSLLLCFPFPIVLALAINQIRRPGAKQFVQTVAYIPHFISTVVVCGLIQQFCASDGLINNIVELFGGTRSALLARQELFVPIYVISGIWKQIGWNSIIYIAAISGIDPQLYEAAALDGSTRFKNIFLITLPCIMPTIIIMLILRFGSLMSVGSTKILLMYRPVTYETADVFGTYAYRVAFSDGQMSYSTAIDLFTSLVNLALLLLANLGAKKVSETSLF